MLITLELQNKHLHNNHQVKLYDNYGLDVVIRLSLFLQLPFLFRFISCLYYNPYF